MSTNNLFTSLMQSDKWQTQSGLIVKFKSSFESLNLSNVRGSTYDTVSDIGAALAKLANTSSNKLSPFCCCYPSFLAPSYPIAFFPGLSK